MILIDDFHWNLCFNFEFFVLLVFGCDLSISSFKRCCIIYNIRYSCLWMHILTYKDLTIN